MNFDKITRMDEAITELELAQEKAFTICDDLFQHVFFRRIRSERIRVESVL